MSKDETFSAENLEGGVLDRDSLAAFDLDEAVVLTLAASRLK